MSRTDDYELTMESGKQVESGKIQKGENMEKGGTTKEFYEKDISRETELEKETLKELEIKEERMSSGSDRGSQTSGDERQNVNNGETKSEFAQILEMMSRNTQQIKADSKKNTEIIKADIEENSRRLEEKLRIEMSRMREEFREDNNKFRNEMADKIEKVKVENQKQLEQLEGRVDEVAIELGDRIDETSKQILSVSNGLNKKIEKQANEIRGEVIEISNQWGKASDELKSEVEKKITNKIEESGKVIQEIANLNVKLEAEVQELKKEIIQNQTQMRPIVTATPVMVPAHFRFGGLERECPCQFIKCMESYFEGNGLSGKCQMNVIQQTLTDGARAWYGTLEQAPNNFEDFRELFLERYFGLDKQVKERMKILQGVWKRHLGVSMRDYAAHKIARLRLTRTNWSDTETIAVLSQHFPEQIRFHLKGADVRDLQTFQKKLGDLDSASGNAYGMTDSQNQDHLFERAETRPAGAYAGGSRGARPSENSRGPRPSWNARPPQGRGEQVWWRSENRRPGEEVQHLANSGERESGGNYRRDGREERGGGVYEQGRGGQRRDEASN